MIFYTTWSSNRLESFARARGYNYGIVYAKNNSKGKYFITNIDNEPLSSWIALGWTKEEAMTYIESDKGD